MDSIIPAESDGKVTPEREVRATDAVTDRCTEGGVTHDFRPHHYIQFNRPHTSWRCVWCHGVACGGYGEDDPCMEIYHHVAGHRSRKGITWPISGTRPDVVWATR
jgi:hypothetical protein